jgi:hypothetical protein
VKRLDDLSLSPDGCGLDGRMVMLHVQMCVTPIACVVYTRLVKLFYAFLEVVQDDDRMVVLQSTVDGHTITINPRSSVSS